EHERERRPGAAAAVVGEPRLGQHARDRLLGRESEGDRHGAHEAAREAVGIEVEGAGLESLERAHGDARCARQLVETDAAELALPCQVRADALGATGVRRRGGYCSVSRYSALRLLHGPPDRRSTAAESPSIRSEE